MSREPALLVLGGMNSNPADRRLGASEIRPMQIVVDGQIRPVLCTGSWGCQNLGSMAWHPKDDRMIYTTTGNDLAVIDVRRRKGRLLDVAGLRDVHEIVVIDDVLWLANTGLDEMVAIELPGGRVIRRLELADLQTCNGPQIPQEREGARVLEHFHANQFFEGYEGDRYCLVHHVNGKQLMRRIASRLLKVHGNGGIVNLTTGEKIPLGLKAPHSVRKIEGEYWVLDSGRASIRIYTPDWKLTRTLKTRGWGRGADYSESQGLVYVGISETRKRYLGMARRGGARDAPNMVQILRAQDGKAVGEYLFPEGLEQINNLYLVDRQVALDLLDMGEIPMDRP